jgi:hypothetical protein
LRDYETFDFERRTASVSVKSFDGASVDSLVRALKAMSLVQRNSKGLKITEKILVIAVKEGAPIQEIEAALRPLARRYKITLEFRIYS